jgi:multiple sugar transport system substrate-binding protein
MRDTPGGSGEVGHERALFSATLMMAPLGAQGADLVIWWEEGQAAEEDEAVKEIIAAFEQNAGKQVELVLGPQEGIAADIVAALEAERRTPDFVFKVAETQPYEQWAYEGRLVDLSDVVGHFSDLFEPNVLERATLLNGTTGKRGLYLLPMGIASHHVHVWNSLLERAGLTLADIPKEWDAFWSFWCDRAQPLVRKALGRDDVWGSGLSMAAASVDTENGIWQFIHAYEANYVTHDGPARHRRSGGPAEAHQGSRQLHPDLSQRLHPARFCHVGRLRQ